MPVRVFVLTLLFLPLVTFAQTADELKERIAKILEQIQSLQNRIDTPVTTATATVTATPLAGGSGCPSLSRTLARGASGEDVRALQAFLKGKGFFNEEPTGYFGAITEAALQSFQSAEGIVSSGDAASTGFGVAGPRTRARIAEGCAVSSGDAGVALHTQCPNVPALPTGPCPGAWQKLLSSSCHVGWRCAQEGLLGNQPPFIGGISGPTTVGVGAFSSWKVDAIDPEQSTLLFSVTWGDEGVEDILRSLAGITSDYGTSALLSHAYSKIGAFTMNVNVKDSAGNVSTASLPILVTAASASGTPSLSPLLPTVGTTTISTSCVTPWGSYVVANLGTAGFEPFFTNGLYYGATSTAKMKCDNGIWQKCTASGTNCQKYVAPTSTPTTGLQSYANVIGTPCGAKGGTKQVTVPPGTQLCQKLSCFVTTEIQTLTLTCSDHGWSDFIK